MSFVRVILGGKLVSSCSTLVNKFRGRIFHHHRSYWLSTFKKVVSGKIRNMRKYLCIVLHLVGFYFNPRYKIYISCEEYLHAIKSECWLVPLSKKVSKIRNKKKSKRLHCRTVLHITIFSGLGTMRFSRWPIFKLHYKRFSI